MRVAVAAVAAGAAVVEGLAPVGDMAEEKGWRVPHADEPNVFLSFLRKFDCAGRCEYGDGFGAVSPVRGDHGFFWDCAAGGGGGAGFGTPAEGGADGGASDSRMDDVLPEDAGGGIFFDPLYGAVVWLFARGNLWPAVVEGAV